jgi:hypothetical protein
MELYQWFFLGMMVSWAPGMLFLAFCSNRQFRFFANAASRVAGMVIRSPR